MEVPYPKKNLNSEYGKYLPFIYWDRNHYDISLNYYGIFVILK